MRPQRQRANAATEVLTGQPPWEYSTPMKRLTTKTRFRLGVAAALIAHRHLKAKAYAHIYKETEIFVGAVEATRTYVKDVLRPEISRHLPPDAFVPCAMSTSYVGREIMARLKKRFPNFREPDLLNFSKIVNPILFAYIPID